MANNPVDELVVAITGLSKLPLAGRYAVGARVHDLYEGFVFALVLATAKSTGAGVNLYSKAGPRSDIELRTQPGRLWPAAPGITWADVQTRTNRSLQVHAGVYVRGYRGTSHECDVALLTAQESLSSLVGGRDPRSREGLILGVECKYRTKRNPGLGEARALLGLASELTYGRTGFACNRPSASVQAVFERRKPKVWGLGLWPGNEGDFVRQVQQLLT